MNPKFLLVCIFALVVCLNTAGSGPAQAQGQIYVLESTAPNVKAGSAFAMDDRVTVPAGASVRVVTPSGKTQTIKGPYSGKAADLTTGEKANDGVIAWIKNLVQTGGSNEKTPGATRSMRTAEAPTSFSWTAVPTATDSTFCVEKGAKLQLRRASPGAADRITVVDLTTTARADVEFAADSTTTPWPAGVTPRDDGAYTLLAPENRPRRQVTLRVLSQLPGDDDILAALAERECKYQFDAWVKEKLAAGKGKAS